MYNNIRYIIISLLFYHIIPSYVRQSYSNRK
uniref:Uncharacterized protein n=1 Tax=Anguilla anguilla TaxID=7936 RepID=A0A0E9WH31_ANGAN